MFFAYPRAHADWTDGERLTVTRDGHKEPVEVTLRDGGVAFTAEKGTYRVSYK